MIWKKRFIGRSVLVTLMVLMLVWLSPATSLAAPPGNDNFANPEAIDGLPFSHTVDIGEATTEPDELQFCNGSPQTVWYSFTPTSNAMVKADMNGSNFGETNIVIYQAVGPEFGGLNFLNCTSFGGSLTFSVQAGTTYYLQAGNVFGGGGVLQLNLQEVLPPPNDSFSNATNITSIPFDDNTDTSATTTELGEPTPSCAGAPVGTLWYTFTAPSTGSLSASFSGSPFIPAFAVYMGSSLTDLTEVSCGGSGLTFPANAGETYYFQVGHFGPGDVLQFHLDVTPPPVASFGFSPGDPSVFDNIQFFDQSFDPGGQGIQSYVWDFGDGATATDCCPTHQYGADGDYNVQLTVTTVDGRQSEPSSQVIQVRTHDVAITKLTAPNAAKAGQTRQISVGVNSKRSPEQVEVQLFKSVPGGFQHVGTLIQSVPVRSANRTTAFDFSYTFTGDDATIGKVTFKAMANLIGARDALPADNEAIALPTKVGR